MGEEQKIHTEKLQDSEPQTKKKKSLFNSLEWSIIIFYYTVSSKLLVL